MKPDFYSVSEKSNKKIKAIPVKNEDYLRINEKKITEDNLRDLPTY